MERRRRGGGNSRLQFRTKRGGEKEADRQTSPGETASSALSDLRGREKIGQLATGKSLPTGTRNSEGAEMGYRARQEREREREEGLSPTTRCSGEDLLPFCAESSCGPIIFSA